MAGFFDILFGGGAEKEAADRNRALAQQYQDKSLATLQQTYGEGKTALASGVAAFDPLKALSDKYGAAGDLWLKALGVGGPAGVSEAINSFQTTPGYNIAQKAGEEAIARRRAISGGYDAGGTDMDLANYVTSALYGTQYQPWLQSLQSAAGMGGQYATTAAQGQAGQYDQLANLASQYGQNQTNVYGNYTGQMTDANKLQAAGEAAGAKNLLGAGLSLVSSIASGGMSNLAGLGSSLVQNTIGQAAGPSAAGQWYSPYAGPVRPPGY